MQHPTSLASSVYVIAELSANHAQNLEIAIQTVRAAAESGANAIKVQTFHAGSLTLPPDYPGFGPREYGAWKGLTSWDLYSKASMPYEWHKPIQEEAKRLNIDFFSTAFDLEGVDFLEELNVPKYKISSFEITDIPLIKKVAKTGKPIIISTGLSNIEDIELCVNTIRATSNSEICLLKCTSEYPAPVDKMNLLGIPFLKEKFNTEVGLSDHSKSLIIPAVAVGLGAKVVERHIILNSEIESVDKQFSTTPEDFKIMVDHIREAEKSMGQSFFSISSGDVKRRKHIFAVRNIAAGEKFSTQNIKTLRAEGKLEPKHFETIIDSTALLDIPTGTPIDTFHFNQ